MKNSSNNLLTLLALSLTVLSIPITSYAQNEGNPLSVAVDNTLNNFVSFGPGRFFSQPVTVNVGSSALQSGNISDNESTALQVLVRGGDRVQFDLRTSTEPEFDELILVLFDLQQNVLDTPFFFSGFVDWRTESYTIPGDGQQFVLAWVYQKDFSLSGGRDAVWVDNVRITRNGVEVDASQRTITDAPWLPPVINLLLEDQ